MEFLRYNCNHVLINVDVRRCLRVTQQHILGLLAAD